MNENTHPATDTHGGPLSAARLAAMAAALSVPDGGFTVDPAAGTDARTGYAVSVHPACEHIYRHRVTADDLADYLTRTRTALALALPGRVFGGWRDPDTGRVYLDVSAVLDTLADALDLGRRAGQRAVFDLAAARSVPIPARADRRDHTGHPISPAAPERDRDSRPVSPVSEPVPHPVSPTDSEVTNPPPARPPADAAKETPAVPASTPRPPHNTPSHNTNAQARTEADNDPGSDPGNVVLPFRPPSTRDHVWTVETPDTEPMTAQHHHHAVTALAALIGQWNERRNTNGGNEKAA